MLFRRLLFNLIFPTNLRRSLLSFIRTQIDIWALSGVSLGGHATLLGLVRDTRWSFAAPIIGCGDFETLMKGRWEGTKKEKRPDTWVSTELKSVLKKLDPVENVDKFKGRGYL